MHTEQVSWSCFEAKNFLVLERFCETLAQHPGAGLYRQVALFTQAFMAVETQAFDMLE